MTPSPEARPSAVVLGAGAAVVDVARTAVVDLVVDAAVVRSMPVVITETIGTVDETVHLPFLSEVRLPSGVLTVKLHE